MLQCSFAANDSLLLLKIVECVYIVVLNIMCSHLIMTMVLLNKLEYFMILS